MAVKGNNAGAPCRPLGRRAVARLFELAFPHAPPRIYMRESKAKGEQSGSLLRSRLRPHSLSARHRSGGATPGWFQWGARAAHGWAWHPIPVGTRHGWRVATEGRRGVHSQPAWRAGVCTGRSQGRRRPGGRGPTRVTAGPSRLTCKSGRGTLRPPPAGAVGGCRLSSSCSLS